MKAHNTKPVILAFLGNLTVAILKFTVAFVSHSAVMFSEGLHSVADTSNQLFLLLGLSRARKPANSEHQFGFGKERFFWSLIAAFGILSIGSALSIQKGINVILHPEEITNIYWPLLVIFVSAFIEGYTLLIALGFLNKNRGKIGLFKFLDDSPETESITIFFEDSAAVIGLLIAGIGIILSYYFQNSVFDGVASIIIGILLGAVAIFLVDKNKDFLTDQAHSNINKKVENIFDQHPAVEKYHDLRTIIFGPEHVIVVADVEFKEEFIYENLPKVENRKDYTEDVVQNIGVLTDQLETEIRNICPEVREIYIEVEQEHKKIRFDKKLS